VLLPRERAEPDLPLLRERDPTDALPGLRVPRVRLVALAPDDVRAFRLVV
jgi:hypothetical protein